MHVAELCRYPVKSLQGERLESVPFTADGLEGDRRFAIFDSETGLGLTARRVPALLFGSARLLDGGALEITLPDGSIARDDGALADWLGTRVALRSSDEHIARRYENPLDFERESTSDWARFDGADRAFHDSPDVRVSLLSTATIGSGIDVASGQTCCSTATGRTSSSEPRSRSAVRSSTSAWLHEGWLGRPVP
jgi:uncharacterized protein